MLFVTSVSEITYPRLYYVYAQHLMFRKAYLILELAAFVYNFKLDKICIPNVTSLHDLRYSYFRDISEGRLPNITTEPKGRVFPTETIYILLTLIKS